MDIYWLLPLLALFTLLAVCVFALVSKHKVEQRMHDPEAPKSALAPDSTGPGAKDVLEKND